MRIFRAVVPAVALLAVAATASACGSTTSTSATGAGAAAAATPSDWYAYHLGSQRGGYASTMPTPTAAPTLAHNLTLDGQVYGSPIVVKGRTIVVTENDTVYAFDANFQQVWKRHLGTPVRRSSLPCGNIDPLGITGTPTYAAVTNSIYLATTTQGTKPTHTLYSIDLAKGGIHWLRPLDFPGVDQTVMNQRGALTTASGGVYVPFGGLAGDCGNYKGRVVRYSIYGNGSPSTYTVPTTREAGMWTPPGLSFDGTSLYGAVGNGESGVGDPYDHSDSILRFTPSLGLADYFSPSNWARENDQDLDLGSQGATLVGPWVFAAGKSGTAYVLRRSSLGHIGGQVSSMSLCTSFGGTAVVGSTVLVPCTDGVRAVSISSTGTMKVLWHAASNITGSPVVGGTRVWTVDPNGGKLYGLDLATGAVRSTTSIGTTTRFATPALYGRTVAVGTTKGLAVVAYR